MRLFKEWLITVVAGLVGGAVGMLIPSIIGIGSRFSWFPIEDRFVVYAALFGGCLGAMLGGTIASRWIDRPR